MPSSLSDKEEEVPPNAAEATEGKMLLLTVSAGKLGLTIRADNKLGGVTITAIDPSCTFKDRVEIGDRLVTVDGQKITKIADLQINNTKQRQFGVVKKIVQQTTEKNEKVPPPTSTTKTAAANAASTPKGNNSKGNPVVTTEKTTTAKKNAKKQNEADETLEGNFQVSITCPDGSKINLSSDQGNRGIILGRGKHGIPSTSKVPIQMCALRVVEKYASDDDVSPPQRQQQFALELTAIEQRDHCKVLRGRKSLFVASAAQMMARPLDTTCPSSIVLQSGDSILPYKTNSSLYEFKIEIVAGCTSPVIEGSDKSAFAAASKRIIEAAAMPDANKDGKSSDGGGETAVVPNLFDFDKESLRRTFLEKPNSTTDFFLEYYKNLSKKDLTNANMRLGDNVLTAFVDAMSPQDVSTLDSNMVLSGTVESFPLEQILEILLQGKHTQLGKRAIEGYLWLSCRKYKRMHSGVDEPTGPVLLTRPTFPLISTCKSIGWDNLEALLVESMGLLCKYSRTSIRPFALLEKLELTASSGTGDNAQLRVFSRLAKTAYSKWFTAQPEETAIHFVAHNRRIRENSHNASVLINAFVDAMSPSDSASRRVPLREINYYRFPLRSILSTILSDDKNKELGKRVLEGYVWLSCQKCSIGTSKPRGPEKLADTLDIACKTIGWGLLADVLVESVEKLCEFNNTTKAFELMEAISRTPSSGEESQRSLICARVAKLTTRMLTIDRFRSNPNSTSKFFVTQYRHLEKDSSNKQFCTELLNCFVDIMSPRDPGSCRKLAVQLHQEFPLKDILRILVDGGHIEFGKRVFTGYLWLSSQRVSYYVDGPRLLDTVDVLLVKLCNALGWNEFEDALVESVEMLCKHRSSREAVSFVDKIAPDVSEGSSHRHRICSKMAKIACDPYIESLNRGHQYKSASDLPVYKKLLWLVGNYCPAIAPKFVSLVKKLDVDALLYPLVTDVALRSGSSADSFKKTLSELTNYCAQLLNTRAESDPDVVTAWTISNPGLCANLAFGGFLQSQCKKTFDWKVRKSDHKGFLAVLRPLINAGEITCRSYQPGYSGPYYFKITKLKTCRVALSALSCSCTRDQYDSRQEPSSCLRQSSQKERREDKAKLDAIKVYLTPEQIRGLSSQKRKADALGGDVDDDVVFTGVSGVEEAVAKRVKAAEDAGEVIEIL